MPLLLSYFTPVTSGVLRFKLLCWTGEKGSGKVTESCFSPEHFISVTSAKTGRRSELGAMPRSLLYFHQQVFIELLLFARHLRGLVR